MISEEVKSVFTTLESLKSNDSRNSKRYNYEYLVLKSICEHETLQNKQLCTILKVYAHVKNLLEKEKDYEKICGLIELLTHFCPFISDFFFQNFSVSIIRLYKDIINQFSEDNFIVRKMVVLFYYFLKTFQKEEDWMKTSKNENNNNNFELRDMFYVGIFQYIKDKNNKIRVLSTRFVKEFVDMKFRFMNEFIGNLLINELNQEICSSDVDKEQSIMYLLKVIHGNILSLPSSFIFEICKVFIGKLIIQKKEFVKQILLTFNRLFCYEKRVLSNEVYINLVKILMYNVNIKEEGSYLFVLKNAFSKKIIEIDRNYYYSQLPILFSRFILFYKLKKRDIASIATKCMQEMIREGIFHPKNQEFFIKDAYEKKQSSCLWKVFVEVKKGLNFWNAEFIPKVLAVVRELFRGLKEKVFPMMTGFVKELLQLQKQTENAPAIRDEVEKTLGICISQVGPEAFFKVVPITVFYGKEKEIWILPVLFQYLSNTSLKFFFDFFLPLAQQMRKRSIESEKNKNDRDKFRYKMNCLQIWNLLVRFCILPTDLTNVFPSVIENLMNLVQNNLDIRLIVLRALTKLIRTNQKVFREKVVPKKFNYSVEKAEMSLKCVSSYSDRILKILFPLFSQIRSIGVKEKEIKKESEGRQVIGNCISAFMSISDENIISNYFRSIMQILLRSTKSEGKKIEDNEDKDNVLVKIGEELNMDDEEDNKSKSDEDIYESMNLAISIIPHLSMKSIRFLYTLLKSQINEEDVRLQKKTYKAFHEISIHKPEFIKQKQEEIFTMIVKNISTYTPSSAKFRFQILIQLFKIVDSNVLERGIKDILCEALIGYNMMNNQTRSYSRVLLDVVIRKYVFNKIDIEVTEKSVMTQNEKKRFVQIFQWIFGGLAGKGPSMVSGTVKGFSYLMKNEGYMKKTQELGIFMPIFRNILKLLEKNNGDVFRSTLHFIKTLLKVMNPHQFQPFCPQILNDMIEMYQLFSSGNFPFIIKLIIEKMIRLYGFDYVNQIFPADHIKLLKGVNHKMKQKKKKRKKRKKNKLGKDQLKKLMKIQIKLDEKGEEMVDFFGGSKSIGALSMKRKRGISENDYMKSFDNEKFEVLLKDGKLVIQEKGQSNENNEITDYIEEDEFPQKRTGKKRKQDELIDDYDDEQLDDRRIIKRMKISKDLQRELDYVGKSEYYIRNKEKQRKRKERFSNVDFGEKFKSRDGRSDKMGDGSQPFAYIPLDPSVLSKRNKNKETGFDRYVKLQKKGRKARKIFKRKN